MLLKEAAALRVLDALRRGNAFYVIDFQVGEGEPPIGLDLPIPGKGDSLRSRHLGQRDAG